MKYEGPRNIGLSSISGYKFPITAISSILHRMTGVIMVLLLPFLLWAFSLSMHSEDSFIYIQYILTSTYWSVLSWVFMSAISYHVIAGIRHLIMDLGFGEEMAHAKITSLLVMALGLLISIFWGVWIWLV